MAVAEPRLQPPPTKGNTSVAKVLDDWYVICASSELRNKPIARTLMGMPLVVFRNAANEVGALLDRCPHRNVPLSEGRIAGELLECAYHGWRFDTEGACRQVPGLCGPQEAKGRRVMQFAARELDGYVWVYGRADTEPARDPFPFPLVDDERYAKIRYEMDFPGSVHAIAENALDVPHTAFLHKGLFRGDSDRNEIEFVVRRWHDRVEAEYIGEPRPEGLVGRILAPGGGTVEHFDRFILPCIAQVEYKLGDRSHMLLSTAITPISDFESRMYAMAAFRLPIPHWLIAAFLKPIALRILRQDARMLRRQTDTIEQFGGEQYMSTDVDVLGPHILRLMLQAERGNRTPVDEPFTRRSRMLV